MFSLNCRVLACNLILWIVSASALSQTGAPPSAALLEGTVVNKVTGAPVRHAHVAYLKIPSQGASAGTTDTDSDGHFSVLIEAGSYRIWVEKPGFAAQTYGASTPEGGGAILGLAPGQQARDVNFLMVPLGAIAGRVFDEDSEPLQNTSVQVLRFSFATGRRQLIPITSASTNDRGEYRAYNLAAGKYFLLATPRPAPTSRPAARNALLPEVQQSFVSVYYPGVLDFASASEISLPEGGDLSDVDFHIQKTPAVMVRGRLISPVQDFAGSRLQVVLAHNDGGVSSMGRTTAIVDENTGRFEFHGIAAGSYLLIASQLHGELSLSGRVPIEVSATGAGPTVNVGLTAAFELNGNIGIEGNSATKIPLLVVQLMDAEGMAFGKQPSAQVGPDGSFRLSGVTPGIWDFTVSPLPENLWIKTATLGNIDASRGELDLSAGARGPFHIVLAGNGAQISGAVTQGGQPSRAVVLLAPVAAELQGIAQMYRSTVTQQDGTFLFRGVRPGAYKLFAFGDVEPYAWLDPEFLKPVESLGEAISVGEGERTIRQLTPIPPDALLPGR